MLQGALAKAQAIADFASQIAKAIRKLQEGNTSGGLSTAMEAGVDLVTSWITPGKGPKGPKPTKNPGAKAGGDGAKEVEVGSTRHVELEPADNGGYKVEFESGKGYAGKGGTDRSRRSARKHSRENNDPVKNIDHFPADNDVDAFDIEATFLNELGGPGSPGNYNQRNSPGTPF